MGKGVGLSLSILLCLRELCPWISQSHGSFPRKTARMHQLLDRQQETFSWYNARNGAPWYVKTHRRAQAVTDWSSTAMCFVSVFRPHSSSLLFLLLVMEVTDFLCPPPLARGYRHPICLHRRDCCMSNCLVPSPNSRATTFLSYMRFDFWNSSECVCVGVMDHWLQPKVSFFFLYFLKTNFIYFYLQNDVGVPGGGVGGSSHSPELG